MFNIRFFFLPCNFKRKNTRKFLNTRVIFTQYNQRFVIISRNR